MLPCVVCIDMYFHSIASISIYYHYLLLLVKHFRPSLTHPLSACVLTEFVLSDRPTDWITESHYQFVCNVYNVWSIAYIPAIFLLFWLWCTECIHNKCITMEKKPTFYDSHNWNRKNIIINTVNAIRDWIWYWTWIFFKKIYIFAIHNIGIRYLVFDSYSFLSVLHLKWALPISQCKCVHGEFSQTKYIFTHNQFPYWSKQCPIIWLSIDKC